jgi:hypothetical protein
VINLQPGQMLFKDGDKEKRTFYLLDGKLELIGADGTSQFIESGQVEARNPLAPRLPRRCTAKASSAVKCISIDTDLMDVMLTWDQTGHYEVSELNEDEATSNDWMTTLLQTKAFHRIPPGNIQAIFMRMQQVNYSAGDTVIQQGEQVISSMSSPREAVQ